VRHVPAFALNLIEHRVVEPQPFRHSFYHFELREIEIPPSGLDSCKRIARAIRGCP
jgi:hypothetical protein